MKFRAFINKIAGKPLDAADLHPRLALPKTSKGEYEAGLAAELADVPDLPEGADPPSSSRKKRSQVLLPRRMRRRFRKSKLATWRDSETAMKRHRKARAERVKREKTSRRRNGWRRKPQG